MHVRRHPNGGFVLDACWHVQTSFRMPPRVTRSDGGVLLEEADPLLSDEGLEVTVERQMVEARAYNLGRPLPCLEDELEPYE